MSSWTVTSVRFPTAISGLCLDIAKTIQLGDVTSPWTGAGRNRIRIPLNDNSQRVYEVCSDATVAAWDEESGARFCFPAITYYKVGLFGTSQLKYLISATLESQRIAISSTGRKVA